MAPISFNKRAIACILSSLLCVVVANCSPPAEADAPAGTPPASLSFLATPTSGAAPLIVKFCSKAGIAIHFGDGATSGMGISNPGDCPPGFGSFVSHTYLTAGTYQLSGAPCPGAGHTECGQAAEQAGHVTISVK